MIENCCKDFQEKNNVCVGMYNNCYYKLFCTSQNFLSLLIYLYFQDKLKTKEQIQFEKERKVNHLNLIEMITLQKK